MAWVFLELSGGSAAGRATRIFTGSKRYYQGIDMVFQPNSRPKNIFREAVLDLGDFHQNPKDCMKEMFMNTDQREFQHKPPVLLQTDRNGG